MKTSLQIGENNTTVNMCVIVCPTVSAAIWIRMREPAVCASYFCITTVVSADSADNSKHAVLRSDFV